MTRDRYSARVSGTNNCPQDRFRNAVVNLDEVDSLINQKIDRAFRSFRCIGNDADLGPKRRIAIKYQSGKKESGARSLARINLLAHQSEKSQAAARVSNSCDPIYEE